MLRQHDIAAKKGTVNMFDAALTEQYEQKPSEYLVKALHDYIDQFNKKNLPDQTGLPQTLITALKTLCEKLRADLIIQNDKKRTEEAIAQSHAFQVAQHTLDFIGQWVYINEPNNQDSPDKKSAALLKLIMHYKEFCDSSINTSSFSKTLFMVLSLSIGFTLGLIVGSTFGLLLGIWAGPGAVMSAIIGLSAGAVTGAAIGIIVFAAAASLLTGIVAFNKHPFFKPKLESAITDVVTAAKDVVTEAKPDSVLQTTPY
jgi:F0F1-type ATP synthase assembly protein I